MRWALGMRVTAGSAVLAAVVAATATTAAGSNRARPSTTSSEPDRYRSSADHACADPARPRPYADHHPEDHPEAHTHPTRLLDARTPAAERPAQDHLPQ